MVVFVTGSMQKVSAELLKVKLHAKSKIAGLTSQLNQFQRTAADTADVVYCISA